MATSTGSFRRGGHRRQQLRAAGLPIGGLFTRALSLWELSSIRVRDKEAPLPSWGPSLPSPLYLKVLCLAMHVRSTFRSTLQDRLSS